MRIGIDARELCGRPTGVGRYLAGLLREWAAAATGAHEFVLFAAEAIELPFDSRRLATRIVAGTPGTWWEQVQVPRAVAADRLDVWFAPAYSAPLRLHLPIVLAVHDLSFVAHPEWFRFREGARRRWLTRHSARKASAVVTISDFSKRELIERLHVPERRVHVIPPGISAADFAPGARPGVSHQSAGGRSPVASLQPPASSLRVLFVGSIFNRRHVPDLIRAFAPVARSHPQASLDIVGDNRSYPPEDLHRTIVAEGLERQVRWHEYVTDTELDELYARAQAFAFLSEYEGLGLTPLEALAAGVPPVLLDTPVARESCGDAAVYVSLHDVAATTRALEAVLFDERTRLRILTAAPAALAKYSWPRAARETLSVIERCVPETHV